MNFEAVTGASGVQHGGHLYEEFPLLKTATHGKAAAGFLQKTSVQCRCMDSIIRPRGLNQPVQVFDGASCETLNLVGFVHLSAPGALFRLDNQFCKNINGVTADPPGSVIQRQANHTGLQTDISKHSLPREFNGYVS